MSEGTSSPKSVDRERTKRRSKPRGGTAEIDCVFVAKWRDREAKEALFEALATEHKLTAYVPAAPEWNLVSQMVKAGRLKLSLEVP